MKNFLLTLASLLIAAAAHGQGAVIFGNLVVGVDAPVYYSNGNQIFPADGNFVAQLYASPPAGTLAPVGRPIAFWNVPEARKGYWPDETRQILSVPVGDTAQVQVFAWRRSLGATYEEAVSKGVGDVGFSGILPSVVTGGDLTPPTALIGLQSFTLSSIPEPSIAALGLLGAGVLMASRRRTTLP